MELGKHSYTKPNPENLQRSKTFSVGVFEWVWRYGGRGLKAGKAKVRVTGPTENPEAVFEKAEEVVKLLDNGDYVQTHVSV